MIVTLFLFVLVGLCIIVAVCTSPIFAPASNFRVERSITLYSRQGQFGPESWGFILVTSNGHQQWLRCHLHKENASPFSGRLFD